MPAIDIAFQIIAPLSMILVLLPLPWHWSARNVGTLLYIAWTFTGTLIFFVNSIVWSGNLDNPAPVWCDITSKFLVGLGVAVPAVSLCINRRLYNIATMKQVSLSESQRRRATFIDLFIGLGIPCMIMATHYIVQGHRFDIIEDYGCAPTAYNVPPAVPLLYMWPSLLGLVSMCYSILSISAFMKQRRTFNAVLNGQSHLNLSRYTRLMALAATDILLDLPISIFILWSNTRNGFEPYISWADTHYDFSNVEFIPAAALKAQPGAWEAMQINRWASPMLAIIFFVFFGLAGESLVFYRGVLERLPGFHRLKRNSQPPLSSKVPSTPQSHRLQTRPSMIHIQIDRTCDADLESSPGLDAKSPDFITLQSTDAETIQFPHSDSTSRDDISEASVELGAVHLSRLSSPLDAAGSPVKPTLQ